MKSVRFAVIVCASIPLSLMLPGVAGATPQVGTCTNSYTLYSESQLTAFDPAAADIFGVIDTNGNGYICFKLYPNGDHNGHLGNLVDDKAGPHTS